MLFAEDAIVTLSVNSFNFKEVVGPSGTLNMEGNHTSAVLTLDAGSAVSFATDDALEVKSLGIDLAHSHRCLGRH